MDTDYREVFGVSKVDPGWPERLLHVPTMTSYSWSDGNIYGTRTEPKYNALSYTWGRWEVSQGPSLQVKNITWAVPAVREDCFTVAAFQRILEIVCEGVEFVWVDIACIDQRDRKMKMQEVGRQAQIFEMAENAYVWLHTWDTAYLRDRITKLDSLTARLERELYWQGRPVDDGSDNYVPACFTDTAWTTSVIDVLGSFRQEPWFTSLWTLQEMYLRPGTVLSRTGETVDISQSLLNYERFNKAAEIETVRQCGVSISSAVLELADFDLELDEVDDQALKRILELVECLGFEGATTSNACVLYSATRFRNARDPLDCVYGIMQVFDLRLGEAANPGGNYTLEDLETQMTVALIGKSVIWAQLFVHTHPPRPGKSWVISPYSIFPQRIDFIGMRTEPHAAVVIDTEDRLSFTGGWCAFSALLTVLNNASGPSGYDIFLDSSPDDQSSIPTQLLDPQTIYTSDEHFDELSKHLLRLYPIGLEVWFLGVILGEGDKDEDLGIGLLVLPRADRHNSSTTGDPIWRRIGLCIWSETTDDEPDSVEFENLWIQATDKTLC